MRMRLQCHQTSCDPPMVLESVCSLSLFTVSLCSRAFEFLLSHTKRIFRVQYIRRAAHLYVGVQVAAVPARYKTAVDSL